MMMSRGEKPRLFWIGEERIVKTMEKADYEIIVFINRKEEHEYESIRSRNLRRLQKL